MAQRADLMFRILGLLSLAALSTACVTAGREHSIKPASFSPATVGSTDAASDHSRPEMSTRIEPATWRLPEVADMIYSASCPQHVPAEDFESLHFDSIRVPQGRTGSIEGTVGVSLDGLEFVAGYELVSDDPRFGGFSGLVAPKWGELLSVTDTGDFVSFTLDTEQSFLPLRASIADMHDHEGEVLEGKKHADSEGLAVQQGLALVSFEGSHRILAFDLRSCGAAARGVPVVALETLKTPAPVKPNGGIEALAVSPDGGLIAGIETLDDEGAPLSFAAVSEPLSFDHRVPDLAGKSITGADFLADGLASGNLYTVHRAYSRKTGPRISIARTPAKKDGAGNWELGNLKTLAELTLPAPVDNFEGIAAIRTPLGQTRIYVIADNNFSPRQRNLLFIFDVLEP